MAYRALEIWTKLNSGIYKSQGGGEWVKYYTFGTGPRQVYKCYKQYIDHKAAMERGYGNVGCGKSQIRYVEGEESIPVTYMLELEYISAEQDNRKTIKITDWQQAIKNHKQVMDSIESDYKLEDKGYYDASSGRPVNEGYKDNYSYMRGYKKGQ